ncbi:MAG: hypothetical protein ACJAQT_004313 [Akkermansiaceae bacterium]|jgi:hypothetical protein
MNEPPKPTGFKAETPPDLKAPDNPSFVYEKEKKKATLDDSHPKLANLLHITVVTAGIILSFIIGGSLLFLKGGGGGASKTLGLLFFIGGGVCAVRWLIQLTTPDK